MFVSIHSVLAGTRHHLYARVTTETVTKSVSSTCKIVLPASILGASSTVALSSKVSFGASVVVCTGSCFGAVVTGAVGRIVVVGGGLVAAVSTLK